MLPLLNGWSESDPPVKLEGPIATAILQHMWNLSVTRWQQQMQPVAPFSSASPAGNSASPAPSKQVDRVPSTLPPGERNRLVTAYNGVELAGRKRQFPVAQLLGAMSIMCPSSTHHRLLARSFRRGVSRLVERQALCLEPLLEAAKSHLSPVKEKNARTATAGSHSVSSQRAPRNAQSTKHKAQSAKRKAQGATSHSQSLKRKAQSSKHKEIFSAKRNAPSAKRENNFNAQSTKQKAQRAKHTAQSQSTTRKAQAQSSNHHNYKAQGAITKQNAQSAKRTAQSTQHKYKRKAQEQSTRHKAQSQRTPRKAQFAKRTSHSQSLKHKAQSSRRKEIFSAKHNAPSTKRAEQFQFPNHFMGSRFMGSRFGGFLAISNYLELSRRGRSG